MNHVWVIEMLVAGKWLPCADCALSKKDAQSDYNKLRAWRENNPADEFRVVKYEATK